MWLIECPNDDQGLLRPAVTRAGQVILLCDSGGEAWLDARDVTGQTAIYPSGPEWSVGDGIDITPGTVRWASIKDLPSAWRSLKWQDA